MTMHAVQLHVAGIQIRQLAALHQQLQQQQAWQQQQAILSQILFETEQVAKRVQATARQDLFAAAVIAESWIPGVSGVRAEMFQALEHKRAWVAAAETMTAASTKARNDPSTVLLLQDYYLALSERARLAALPCPADDTVAAVNKCESTVANAHAQLEKAPRRMLLMIVAGAMLPALCVVLFVLGLIGGVAEQGFKTGSSAGVSTAMAGLVGFIPAVFVAGAIVFRAVIMRRRRVGAVSAAEKALTSARAVHAQREAIDNERQDFAESIKGGALLDQLAREHPLLVQAPQQEPDGPASSVVVERQVVVIRCKYCGNVTPVDLDGCKHCGAMLK